MRAKLIIAVGMIAVLFLLVDNLPLTSDTTCIIVITVKDQYGTPINNTRVKLTALDHESQTISDYTDANGDAEFDMIAWPNECGRPPCICPATWNEGDYNAEAVEYCEDVDFYFDGYSTADDITVYQLCSE